jgi:hypothetical protein
MSACDDGKALRINEQIFAVGSDPGLDGIGETRIIAALTPKSQFQIEKSNLMETDKVLGELLYEKLK